MMITQKASLFLEPKPRRTTGGMVRPWSGSRGEVMLAKSSFRIAVKPQREIQSYRSLSVSAYSQPVPDRARISGCETCPDPQPKSRRAVGSRGPERARSGGDHLAQQALAGCGAVGAPSGGTSKICAIATLKTSPKIAAATRRGGSSAAASKESGPSACVGRS